MLYSLAVGLGTKRKDDSDSKFPLKKVVAGLVEYCINFFNAEFPQNVSRMILCTLTLFIKSFTTNVFLSLTLIIL